MSKTVSKKQQFFNKVNLTADDELYIGVDVHKESYTVALYLNGAAAIDFNMSADNAKLLKLLQKVRPAVRAVVYEAGPTGYSLARTLQRARLPIKVIAPSKTPRQSARDSKTDRLDARTLAEYAAKGLLRSIAIPTRLQEADRQLIRTREQLVKKQSRSKLQIKSFLLQHGITQPPALRSWSNNAVNQLEQLQLPKSLRFCLDLLIEQLKFIQIQLKTIRKQLKQAFDQARHARKVKLLQTHPGVGEVIARQFTAEIFDPKRFRNRGELAKYTGLAPTIIQSGQSLRDGPVTKTGRPQLRSNLIEASWIWIRRDPDAHRTFTRLMHNTGHKNKAITAMARRLAVHLWKMLCDNKPYTPAA